MKKIKLFLGGYVNFPNAQNINCMNIARYINKDLFEVHVMYTPKMPIDKKRYKNEGIHLHRLWHHRFVWYWSKWLTMWIGNYDIYYLPKLESVDRNFARRFKGKKCFIASVEGVITETTNNSDEFRTYYMEDMTDFFSISYCIEESVEKYWGRKSKVLPLGIVSDNILGGEKRRINQIIWVANIKANKRPQYLIQCAEMFPELKFIMIGDGDMRQEISDRIKGENIYNIKMLGRISNEDVYANMDKSDLLLMTSEYEGLPKVIQEAAQCSVPSIYIAENYSVDFIENGKNGYAVYSIDEMIEKIEYLVNHPDEYREMAEMSKKGISKYQWENIISDYEEFFIQSLEKAQEV